MIDALCAIPLHRPRVLDVGGYVGEFARLAKRAWPGCYVVAVEANEAAIPVLESIADEAHCAVVWNRDNATVPFWRRNDMAPGGSTGNSVFRENTQFFSDDAIRAGLVRHETRQTTTIDTLFANCEPFDFVKLDIQGSELRAIQGGEDTIRRAQAILCEQQRVEYNKGAPMAHEVDAAIRDLGFDLFWEADQADQGGKQVERMYRRRG